MRMKKWFALSTLLANFAFGNLASALDFKPENARQDAKTQYNFSGYTIFSISNGGESFYGKKQHSQEVIFCALDGADTQIVVHQDKSIFDPDHRQYITLFNAEMMTLLAIDKGCLEASEE